MNTGIKAHPIYTAVLDVLQNAEELGGVRDETQYLELMSALMIEISTRINTCARTLSDDYENRMED